MDGIINIYKEKGYTSHDVVAKLRGILKMKKIGHTGTLDPDAVGVLPVCIGKATSLCEYLTDKSKEYQAVIHFGIVTDTLDLSGEVLNKNAAAVTQEKLKSVLSEFVGDIMQIPPMYSAIKVNGKKLYDIAREGRVIERNPRAVHIYNIDVVAFDEKKQQATINTTVSKGTYIRSLCDDIGKKLGCGACMGELIRTRSGIFDIDSAITLDGISQLMNNGTIDNRIITIESVLDMPCKIVLPEYDKRLINGNNISQHMMKDMDVSESNSRFLNTGDNDICVFLSDGSFVAIYRYCNDNNMYKPLKMFL